MSVTGYQLTRLCEIELWRTCLSGEMFDWGKEKETLLLHIYIYIYILYSGLYLLIHNALSGFVPFGLYLAPFMFVFRLALLDYMSQVLSRRRSFFVSM